ncbi:uncharacterized protein LOC129731599 [Wyeomyia smithii]|uniref:uncharacterized protein LOC129731599 n=1 Tax=Wyeomyia smithii TaxID=174621 RepID=UPI0024681DDA|nr:uncharacterized protein LOC129731599 [Wyeomyia smithii]
MAGSKRQLGAISGGLLLTFCGGIHIGWSVVHLNMSGNGWAVEINEQEYRFAIVAFFTGVGTMLGILGQVKDFLSNRTWLMIAVSFTLINGIIFTAIPIDYTAIVATRIIAGFGHGIAHVIMTIYIGEIASKQFRTKFIAMLTASIIAGITTFTLISMVTTDATYLEEPAMHPNRALGIIIMPLSCAACVLIYFLMVESPIHLLSQAEYKPALNNLKILRDELEESTRTSEEFEDMKLLTGTANSSLMAKMFYNEGNMKAFSNCLTMKLANLLIFNYSMNKAKMEYMSAMFDTTNVSLSWAPSILMLSKLFAALVTIFSIDLLPRRFQYTISATVTGSFLLAFGIVLAISDYVEPWIAPFLYITAEVFTALGMLPISEIQISEAFPPLKKAMSVVGVLICEYVGHIVVFIIYFNTPSTPEGVYIETIVLASVILLKSFLAFFTIPDTRNTTLREALQLLSKSKR